MGNTDAALLARLQSRPRDSARLVVRVTGDTSLAASRLASRGATVLHVFDLIKAVSISCTGETALALAQEPWVSSVEEDRRVSAQ
jgi:hypothetical protein